MGSLLKDCIVGYPPLWGASKPGSIEDMYPLACQPPCHLQEPQSTAIISVSINYAYELEVR